MAADLTTAELADEDRALRDMVRALARAEIAPRAVEVDRDGRFPAEAMAALGAVGLLGLRTPEAYGGAGGTELQYVLVLEEIARVCGATAATYMTQAHGALPLLLAGGEQQKQRWLPPLARGDVIGAIALTEPGAGSDLGAVETTARRDGHGWVLRGRKMFTTNGGHAGLLCVLARTGVDTGHRGLGVFLVPGDAPGLTTSAPLDKMGIRGSETVELSLDNVRVPDGNLIGGAGDGFRIVMATVDGARVSTAAQAVGLAQGAYDIAFAYAHEREQFGQRIYDFQAVQMRLVDMWTSIEAARALLHRVAAARDRDPDRRLIKEAAMVKVHCSDMAMRVTTDAVQTLGGYGYMKEYQVERYMRDAKITQIYDGTNDINRLVIARELVHPG